MPEAEALLLLPCHISVPSEPGVLGYFEFNASPQPPGYLTFFTSALHSLNKDHLGTIHFGVITDRLIAEEISLASSGSVYLHRHFSASLLYPHEAMNCTAEDIWRWALENQETFIRWLRPHGGKSLLLHNELKKGPALFLFLPFDPLAESHPLVDEMFRLALEYNSCNQSQRGGPDAEHLQGEPLAAAGLPLPRAEAASAARPPCCHTVVLPPQWHAISRTHNVCELCVNQTAGVRPSRLGGPHCSFSEIEAAVDSLYLRERTFFQVVSRTVSFCSNFLSFYSPFSHYTACCRTVNRGLLGFGGAEKTPARRPGAAFASHGKRWKDRPWSSAPHIEDGHGLRPASTFCGANFTGLSCRTNKTLNLYLLDSNLSWMYAERLGAPRAAPVKEFAAIVDLAEEVHYVLDQSQALRRAALESFIQNYSVVYSPLQRHLVGDARPGPVRPQHIREVTTETFHEAVLQSEKSVLLLYYAPWCGFCMSLSHIFIQLARILPPENFAVARVDVSQNDLPWEFMTDHLPNVLFFPHDRKEQSSRFPAGAPLTLPNLLKFILHHPRPPPAAPGPEPCLRGCLWRESLLQQGRIARLEQEVERLRAESQALHRARAQAQAQLSEARREGQRLQQEARALQSHQEHLQGLYEQKSRELEELAEKLRELAEASESLLAENTLLKVLLASMERKLGPEPQPEVSLPTEDAGLAARAPERFGAAEQSDSPHLESQLAPEHAKENWTE
ncbi:thioredoxin domain-containing protein 11 isoform X2 [Varanus komodoensis]|uniref:thioredoxin domain-containing protein 11 isoform X2 n=1 Tax=Varanus komodoensis TaxID=61221 RepID=UPI001CF7DB1A|nr:thioredoxin domain-containing protein 11 isoform X2 [Varanus komodoensis]